MEIDRDFLVRIWKSMFELICDDKKTVKKWCTLPVVAINVYFQKLTLTLRVVDMTAESPPRDSGTKGLLVHHHNTCLIQVWKKYLY